MREYDSAIEFFVNGLQFELVEDVPSLTNDGRPKRWVVVRPPGAETGILLARADGDHQAALVGNQRTGQLNQNQLAFCVHFPPGARAQQMRKIPTTGTIDREKHDDDIAERVIGGVRTERVRSQDRDGRKPIDTDRQVEVPDRKHKQS